MSDEQKPEMEQPDVEGHKFDLDEPDVEGHKFDLDKPEVDKPEAE